MTNDFSEYLNSFISSAILEDVGNGDHSTLACIPPNIIGKAQLVVKEPGVIAGIEIAEFIFKKLDSNSIVKSFVKDGDNVEPNDIAFIVSCNVHQLLIAERLVLNIMQRMSGIATHTRQYVNQLQGLNTKLLDTRKTAPGMRLIDKDAVKIGGGTNHRIGLFDMVMLKDNHIDFAGGIEKAIVKTNQYLTEKGLNIPIIIEARNFDEIHEILKIGNITRIMLDNFSVEETKLAVQLINRRFQTESSGMINLSNIRDYALCGVDYISVGSITHRVQSLDLSLKAI